MWKKQLKEIVYAIAMSLSGCAMLCGGILLIMLVTGQFPL